MADALARTFRHWTAIEPTDSLPLLNQTQLRFFRALRRNRNRNHLHVSVGELVHALYVHPPMRQHPLGPWIQVRVRRYNRVARNLQDQVFDILFTMLQMYRHPLRGNEARTAVYFHVYILPVIGSLNDIAWLRIRGLYRRAVFRIEPGFTIPTVQTNVNAQQLTLNGRCDFLVRRNGEPFCVVEVKRFNRLDTIFNQARDQAFVYAASIAHTIQTRSMLAIVTDLRRWQLLRVRGANREMSQVFIVDHHRDGAPVEADIVRLHQHLMRFLYDG